MLAACIFEKSASRLSRRDFVWRAAGEAEVGLASKTILLDPERARKKQCPSPVGQRGAGRNEEEDDFGPAPARVAKPWGQGHLDAADAPAGLK